MFRRARRARGTRRGEFPIGTIQFISHSVTPQLFIVQTCEKSEEKMEEEDWESESSGTGSRSDQPKIPVPGPQDCNIPDFSRLGVSTSGRH